MSFKVHLSFKYPVLSANLKSEMSAFPEIIFPLAFVDNANPFFFSLNSFSVFTIDCDKTKLKGQEIVKNKIISLIFPGINNKKGCLIKIY
jgi:hypothetical protein